MSAARAIRAANAGHVRLAHVVAILIPRGRGRRRLFALAQQANAASSQWDDDAAKASTTEDASQLLRLERPRLELPDETDLGVQLIAELLADGSLSKGDEFTNVLCRGAAEVDQNVGVHVRDL